MDENQNIDLKHTIKTSVNVTPMLIHCSYASSYWLIDMVSPIIQNSGMAILIVKCCYSIQDADFVITIPVDDLAPYDRPSAGKVLTTKFDIISSSSFVGFHDFYVIAIHLLEGFIQHG